MLGRNSLRKLGKRFNVEISVSKILFFAGSARCGTTVIAQILNLHPACVVASEARLATNLFVSGMKQEKALAQTAELALAQYHDGLESSAVSEESFRNGQKKWISAKGFGTDPVYRKESISVIGDKNAGSFSNLVMSNTGNIIERLSADTQFHVLHVVRNPIHSSVSHLTIAENIDFAGICGKKVQQHMAASALKERLENRYMAVYYEDLQERPAQEIERLVSWLGLGAEAQWIDGVSALVNQAADPTPSKEHQDYLCRLLGEHARNAILGRYDA